MVEIGVKTMVSSFLFNQIHMIQIATDICETSPPVTGIHLLAREKAEGSCFAV